MSSNKKKKLFFFSVLKIIQEEALILAFTTLVIKQLQQNFHQVGVLSVYVIFSSFSLKAIHFSRTNVK